MASRDSTSIGALVPDPPDLDAPLVPWAASTSLTDVDHQKRTSAWKGALAAGLPSLLILAPLREFLTGAAPALAAFLDPFLPGFLLPFAVLSILFLTPALLAFPVAVASAISVRREGRRDRELGMAAAAGAGMGSATLAVGAVLFECFRAGEPLLIPIWLGAAALGVGVVGAGAFAAVPGSKGKRIENAPGLYHGLLAAGLGGPALLVGGGFWATAAYLVPELSPWWLASLAFSGSLASAVATSITLLGLAPVTYVLARTLRRRFPGAPAKALLAGLVFPPLVPFLALLGVLAMHLHDPFFPALATVLGGAAAVSAHAAAALLGLGKESPSTPRRLPGAKG